MLVRTLDLLTQLILLCLDQGSRLLALYWLPSYLTGPLVEYRSKLFEIFKLFQ